MLRRVALSLVALLSLSVPLRADPVDDLVAALKLPQLFEVLREEGVSYGAELERDLFPGEGGARWTDRVATIHEASRMEGIATDRLRQDLATAPEAVAQMLAYFNSEPGQRIVDLEIAARSAFLDESLRAAAEENYAEMARAQGPRLRQLRKLVDVNDLIEQNVAGGLNSSLAFYRGMVAGGALEEGLSESEMMADLWSQEPQVREETLNWVFPYLALAYQPISDAQLQAYIAFSESPAGQQLNTALFGAFETVFNGISEALGRSAAEFLAGEDI